MSFVTNLIHAFLESQASHVTLDDLGKKLRTEGESITARLKQAADTPANRTQAGHVIGIERWGAHRLAAALAGNAAQDEYDGYRPSANLSMPVLADEFFKARQETLGLIEPLRAYGEKTIPHNNFGEISVKAWLSYLNRHASLESRKIR